MCSGRCENHGCDRKYRKALALPCLMFEPLPNAANSSDALRLDSILRELRKLLCYYKHGCFGGGNAFGPPRKPWLWTEKNQKALALLGLASGPLPNAVNSSVARVDRVGSRTDNKDEVVESKFSYLNFLPSTKKTTEYSF